MHRRDGQQIACWGGEPGILESQSPMYAVRKATVYELLQNACHWRHANDSAHVHGTRGIHKALAFTNLCRMRASGAIMVLSILVLEQISYGTNFTPPTLVYTMS